MELSWTVLLGLCLVAVARGQVVTCRRFLDSVSPPVTRLTCSGTYFNFSKISFTAQRIFAAGTNTLFHLNNNLTIAQQVSVVDPQLRSACRSQCDTCVSEAITQSLLGFCRSDGATMCLPHLVPLCENWISVVRPVTDSNNKEYLLTCGTASMFRNVSNCQIRSTSNLAQVHDSFQATLTVSSARPSSFVTFGSSTAVNTSGHVISQFYTAGHIPYEGLFFRRSLNRGFLNNFDYLQLDVLERRNSMLMTPPRADFDLTWYSFLENDQQVNEDANTGQFTHYHLQYVYQGYVYVWASGVGLTERGPRTHGAYVWRYCVDDHQNATYLASLRRIRVACTGISQLRDFVSRNTGAATSRWAMNQMTAAVEVSQPTLSVASNGPYVVASFTTLDPLPLASSICAYNKENVRDAFNNNPGRNYKIQPCDPYYTGTFGACASTYSTEFVTNFTNIDITLSQNALYPSGRPFDDVASPLWMRNGVRISDITYGTYANSYYIFATTHAGTVFRLASLRPNFNGFFDGMVFTLINELTVGQFDGDAQVEVSDIQFLQTTPATVAVVTRRSVTTLQATDCEQYAANCSTCLGLQMGSNSYNPSFDPSCAWCTASRTCVVRGENTCPSANLYPSFRLIGPNCSPYPSRLTFNGSIVANPPDHTAYFNSSASFECRVSGSLPIAVAWLRLVGVAMVAVDTSSSRISSTDTTNTDLTVTSVLLIRNVVASDGGRYVCSTTQSFSSSAISAPATLMVAPYLEVEPLRAIAFRSQAVTMSCRGVGYPQPSYRWFVNGADITSYPALYPNVLYVAGNAEIVFTPTNVQNSGFYTCYVFSAVGEATSSSAQLTVIDAEPSSSQVLTPSIGTSVVLSCPTVSATTYMWYFDGSLLPLETARTLTLANVQASHSGRYLCQQSDQFFVYATGPPRLASAPRNQTVAIGTLVELRCAADAGVYPASVLRWSFRAASAAPDAGAEAVVSSGPVVLLGNNQVLIIPAVTYENAGTYTCHASNGQGNATASATVVVQVPLSVSQCPEGDMFLALGTTPLTFTCVVRGPAATAVRFSFGADVLRSEDRFSVVTTRNVSAGEHTAVFTIDSPIATDAGRYTCSGVYLDRVVSCRFIIALTAQPEVGASTSSSTSEGTLIGASVGCAVLGLLLGGILVYLTVKRNDRRKQSNALMMGHTNMQAQIQNRNEAIPPKLSKAQEAGGDFGDGSGGGAAAESPMSGDGGHAPLDRGISRTTEVSRLSFTPSTNGSSASSSMKPSTPMSPIGSVSSPMRHGNGSLGNANAGTPELVRQTSKV